MIWWCGTLVEPGQRFAYRSHGWQENAATYVVNETWLDVFTKMDKRDGRLPLKFVLAGLAGCSDACRLGEGAGHALDCPHGQKWKGGEGVQVYDYVKDADDEIFLVRSLCRQRAFVEPEGRGVDGRWMGPDETTKYRLVERRWVEDNE